MSGEVKNMKNNVFQKWWISDPVAGNLKKIVYLLLQKIYLFDSWHLEPINFRPYAQEIVLRTEKYINQRNIRCVVEVGGGLGDIIGNINAPRKKCKKIGIDKEHSVVKAARLLHPSVMFLQGSFERCVSKDDICLIMVNFIHKIPKDELKEEMQRVLSENRVKLVIMDTFSRNKRTCYIYSHSGEDLFDGKYKCIRRSRAFAAANGARRYVEYWEKIEK